MAGRVFVYGLDGVPLWFLRDAAEKGYIKNISRLMDTGVYGILNAIPPINTPPNWYSAFTGVDPGVHGIIGFYTLDNQYKVKYFSARDRKIDPVWVIVSRYGKRSIIVNVPLTYPPDNINGYMVSGEDRYGPPTEEHVHPKSIYNLVRDSGYQIGIPLKGPIDNALKQLYDNLSRRGEVTRSLMERSEWDLTIVVYREPDFIMHKFLGLDNASGGEESAKKKYSKVPYEILSKLDDELGKYMEYLDEDDHIIIMSDHGHKPKKLSFSINLFKARNGLLKVKYAKKRKKLINLGTLRRIGFLRWIWYKLSYNTRYRIKSLLLKIAELDKGIDPSVVDWSRTKAICYMKPGAIKINLIGRDKDGTVSINEYDEVVAEIKRMLLGENDRWIREYNMPMLRGVYSVKEVYREYDDPLYPDLFIIPHEDVVLNIQFYGDSIVNEVKTNLTLNTPFHAIRDVSDHVPEGVYIMNGPAFNRMGLGPSLNMMDIALFILYLLNLPIPSYMQGTLNKDILRRDWIEGRPVRMFESRRFKIRTRIRGIRRKFHGNI